MERRTARNQALALGFALAVTRNQAPRGPEVWYQAVLKHAGIVLMSKAENDAAYDRLNEALEADWRVRDYEKSEASTRSDSEDALTRA